MHARTTGDHATAAILILAHTVSGLQLALRADSSGSFGLRAPWAAAAAAPNIDGNDPMLLGCRRVSSSSSHHAYSVSAEDGGRIPNPALPDARELVAAWFSDNSRSTGAFTYNREARI